MERYGTFNTELPLDKTVTYPIREQVMDIIGKKFGHFAAAGE